MSWDLFNKNRDTRQCAWCDQTGHVASECPNQQRPAQAPASVRSYACAVGNTASASTPPASAPVATPATSAVTVKRRPDLVAIPLPRPSTARHNPAAALSSPTTARPSSTTVPSITSTSGPATTVTTVQSSPDSIEQKHELGLRIGYGTRLDPMPDGKEKDREVLTNYVRITNRPNCVYVYKLKIVRAIAPNGDELLVKDKAEKKAIFERLKAQNGYSELQTRRDYATDHDLIWATKPLFPATKKDEVSTPRPTQSFLVERPHTQQRILFVGVSITFEKQIDALQSPQDLLRDSDASPERADDAVVLIRGINAFMTQHARDNMTAQPYANTAANRFFFTRAPHEMHLDHRNPRALRAFRGFSVSTRPGVDHMLLNIHVGASPFLENVSVQQLIQKFRTMRLPPRQAFNALRNKEAVVGNSNRPVVITQVGDNRLYDYMKNWNELENELS